MRKIINKEKIQVFMKELAAAASSPGKVYFCGGTTALLFDIRNQTVDIDLKLDPEPGNVFQAISKLKDKLNINVELASPGDFIPAGENWQKNSLHIDTISGVSFYHYDLVLQALAKIERGHGRDIEDVKAMIKQKLFTTQSIEERFKQIEGELIRYPAISQKEFSKKVKFFLNSIS